ncbi:hypothetical protein FEM48_Zijuj12G0134000 [Ziziphus jujuba var. spinosa]|nr:hypothetical protein FEM48_Zijuj12G0134000 [Ziziphus jujuba var. spinosa]
MDSPLASRIRNLLDSKKGTSKQKQIVVEAPAPVTSSTSKLVTNNACTSTGTSSSSSTGSDGANSNTSGIFQDTQFFDDAYKPDLSNCNNDQEFELTSSQSDLSWGGFGQGFDRFSFTQQVLDLPKNATTMTEAADSEFLEFERMKVERQISASLYAMNGVQEYMETVHDPTEALWDLPPLCSLLC